MKASYHCAGMLIRVFAGCTCDIVGFAVLWRTCEFDILTAQTSESLLVTQVLL